MKRKDIVLKGITESLITDCLRFFYPATADDLFDFSQPIDFLDTELSQLNPDLDSMEESKIVDRLIRVPLHKGERAWIYLLMEIHGYNDRKVDYAERMFRCFIRLYDKYGQWVTALLVLTDSSKSFNPCLYQYELLGTKISFSYNSYKVANQSIEELEKSDNPFAIVILTILLSLKQRKKDKRLLADLYIDIAANLEKRGISEDKRQLLLSFIQLYEDFGEPEIQRKFDKELDNIILNTPPMGILEIAREIAVEKARESALNESKTAFVKNLLLKTNHSEQEIADIADVSIDFVLEVRKSLPSSA
jgi:hypothetical protein